MNGNRPARRSATRVSSSQLLRGRKRTRRVWVECLENRALLTGYPGWGFSLGTERFDGATELDVSPSGDLYVTGQFSGTTDFDPGPGVLELTASSPLHVDGFVAKYTSDGQIVWATRLGGPDGIDDARAGTAFDSAGNPYVAGWFESPTATFPMSGGGVTTLINNSTSSNIADGFVARVDDATGQFVWVKQLAGPGSDSVLTIDIDDVDNIYVGGWFEQTVDFDPGPGDFNLTSVGEDDGYLWKFNSDGEFQNAVRIGGASTDRVSRLSLDGAGGLAVSGSFSETADFGVTAGGDTLSLTSAGERDLYVSRWDSGTLDAQWVRQATGTESLGTPAKVAADDTGHVYFSGKFLGEVSFGPGTPSFDTDSPAGPSGPDTFVSKWDPDGDFLWAKHIGGIQTVLPRELELDSSGNLYLAGYFWDEVDFNPDDQSQMILQGVEGEGYILRLDPNGNFQRVYQLQSNSTWGDTQIHGLAIDGSDKVYVGGWFETHDSLTLPGGLVINGSDPSPEATSFDGFVAQLDLSVLESDPPTGLYFSMKSGGTVGGVPFANEDIIAYDGTDFSLLFDGSDVGLGSLKLDAVAVISDTEVLMSFTAATTISGISVDDSDIVLFTGSLGENTSGSFAMYFDGSDMDLSTNGEDVDALAVLPDGRLVMSTTGELRASGNFSVGDEDLAVFTPTTLGAATSGTWEQYYNADADKNEDVDAAAVDFAGRLHMSTIGSFSFEGISGEDEDVSSFTPYTRGIASNGFFESTLLFDGSTHGLSSNDIGAISFPDPMGNQAPTANAGLDQTVSDDDAGGDETVTVDGSGSFDTDGSIVAYQWNEGATDLGNTAVITPTLTVGVHTLSLTVTDNEGETDTDTVVVTVNGNQAPTASAGSDQAVGDGDGSGDQQVTLDGTGSDSDGTVVAYEWKEGSTILGTSASISPLLDVGAHTLTLTVTDNGGLTASDDVLITVNANQAPTANAGPDQAVTDTDGSGSETVTLDGSGQDSDGTIVSYEWKEGATVLGNTASISPSLSIGEHTLTLTVTDNGGALSSDDVVVTVSAQPVSATKFYVVDTSVDDTFEYDAAGHLEDSYNLGSGNTAPRGIAADATGDTLWVVDNDDYVYVYDTEGTLLRSWRASGLSRPEGIASDGTHVWIVDRGHDRVHYFAGGATRTSNSGATSSFALAAGNPRGITTDGSHIWVVDTGSDDVYKYTVDGTFLGNWALDSRNTVPRGITIDPGDVDDIWVVDSTDDAIYQYTAAASRTSGSQSASSVFSLSSGNTNPQGIADPPVPSREGSVAAAAIHVGLVLFSEQQRSTAAGSLGPAQPDPAVWSPVVWSPVVETQHLIYGPAVDSIMARVAASRPSDADAEEILHVSLEEAIDQLISAL